MNKHRARNALDNFCVCVHGLGELSVALEETVSCCCVSNGKS